MIDPHNLGTFNSFEEVWDLYPSGGCPGDYVTVSGIVVRWNEGQRLWGDPKTFQQNIKYERIEGNVEVAGDLKSSTFEADEVTVNTFKTKYIFIENDPYSKIGHNHDDLYSKIGHVHPGLSSEGVVNNSTHADKSRTLDDDTPVKDWFIRKDVPDTAKEIITLLKGVIFGNNKGSIDGYGNAHLKSLILDSFLEVPELRYNRVEVFIGHSWKTNGAGIVESVTVNPDGVSGSIKLKLESGEFGAVAEDDLCMGIMHDEEDPTNNSTDNYDDGIGNYRFAGFGTSYFRITSITKTADNSEFTYTMRPVSDNYAKMIHPKPGMHFAVFANPTNTARQSSRYSTTTYERYLTGLTTWEYSKSNIAMQFGDCSNLSVFGLNMADKSAYLRNIYMSGTIQQLVELPARMEISDDGDDYLAWGEEKNITCKVMKGFDDITSTMVVWEITRDSGDAINDEAWNLAHQNFNGSIILAYKQSQNDLGADTASNISTMFTIFASDQSGTTAEGQLII